MLHDTFKNEEKWDIIGSTKANIIVILKKRDLCLEKNNKQFSKFSSSFKSTVVYMIVYKDNFYKITHITVIFNNVTECVPCR